VSECLPVLISNCMLQAVGASLGPNAVRRILPPVDWRGALEEALLPGKHGILAPLRQMGGGEGGGGAQEDANSNSSSPLLSLRRPKVLQRQRQNVTETDTRRRDRQEPRAWAWETLFINRRPLRTITLSFRSLDI
jgi:hypothetical protein